MTNDDMYYVYVLKMKDNRLYKGYTSDLKRRLKEHEEGRVASTRYKRPLALIHYEAYIRETDARRRERFLKTTEGRRFLKQQIRDLLNDLGPVDKQYSIDPIV